MAVIESLLEKLVPSARLALPYVQSMVEAGLSSSDIQRTLSSVGLGVRRTDLLELIRGIKGVELTRPYIDALRNDVLPSPERLSESLTHTLRDFSYTVTVSGTHLETGELVEQNITISTNDLLTKEQAVQMALDLADSGISKYGFSSHGGKVAKVTRTPGLQL